MNYSIFKIRGINSSSGRSKGYQVSALTEAEALEIGLDKGLVSPFIEERIAHDEPTERQLDYAVDLGIQLPEGAKRGDVSALIDRVLYNDDAPPKELTDFANGRRLQFSLHVGYRSLCEIVFYNLQGVEKAAFFVFRIYLHLSRSNQSNLDLHTEKNFMYHMGQKILDDEKLLKSMENYDGRDLVFFGKRTVDYVEQQGGSDKTAVYKFVAKAISEHYGTSKTRTETIMSSNFRELDDSNSKGSRKYKVEDSGNERVLLGCLGFVFLLLFIYLMVKVM